MQNFRKVWHYPWTELLFLFPQYFIYFVGLKWCVLVYKETGCTKGWWKDDEKLTQQDFFFFLLFHCATFLLHANCIVCKFNGSRVKLYFHSMFPSKECRLILTFVTIKTENGHQFQTLNWGPLGYIPFFSLWKSVV